MATAVTDAEEVTFNRDVLPILSNNCFVCHGPDAGTRKAHMRLDRRDGAVGPYGVIEPGDPEASLLIERITEADPEDRMPPPESGRHLTDEQIQTLREWIAQGAVWEGHWSLTAPTHQPPPSVSNDAWCRTHIDRFILARLDREGIDPSPEADRRTLIRRVTLDLTGLPPTPEEVAAFLEDGSPDAYERLVDHLLASPHFGEHAAVPWLDIARYADSQGWEKDALRTMWRYRDWVIDAFNADMPFDQFTLEQIAGDLLPEPTLAQRIATGFHRNTQTNTEGGTDNEEFRSAAVIDRVSTTLQGWMGLTAGCAQCHDHKFDPISHQEFYELYAFFNQSADADLDDDRPFIKAPTPLQERALADLVAGAAAIKAHIEEPDEALRSQVQAWIASRCGEEDWHVLVPKSVTSESDTLFDVLEDGTVVASGLSPPTQVYHVEVATDLAIINGLRLEAIEGPGGVGPGRTDGQNFVLTEISLHVKGADEPLAITSASATHEQSDYSVAGAIDGDLTTASGWAIAGGTDRNQEAVFRLEDPLALGAGTLGVTLTQAYGHEHTLARFRLAVTGHVEPSVTAPADIQLLADGNDSHTAAEWARLSAFSVDEGDVFEALRCERDASRDAHDAYEQAISTALVMEDLPENQQRTTMRFVRGSFLSPDTELGPLHPSVPAALHPLEGDTARRSRADLARWLVAAENPLTARVQVNRVWQRIFGIGLVETSDNFGVQGARPSHPQLLDWLARHWQGDLAWSPKALARVLVTSATYRQSSRVDPEMLARDPSNRLLSRMPRLRLSAEQVRDTALAAAGILVTDRIGGPSVTPHVPKGMLPQAFTTFVQGQSSGDDLYRRGLYTQWRRTGHYPTFATFDAPSREECQVGRERSNTPLQALVLLNDAAFLAAAQGMARRTIAAHPEDVDARIGAAFEWALARPPSDQEQAILRDVHDAALAVCDEGDEDSAALATEPLGPLPADMAVDDAVAMTVACNVILNLDEFVNRP